MIHFPRFGTRRHDPERDGSDDVPPSTRTTSEPALISRIDAKRRRESDDNGDGGGGRAA